MASHPAGQSRCRRLEPAAIASAATTAAAATRPSSPNAMRKLADRIAAWVISIAGISVIAAMFAMLALIVREAAPLFIPASQREVGSAPFSAGVDPAAIAAVGTDSDLLDRSRVAAVILKDGRHGFSVLRDGVGSAFSWSRLPSAPDGETITTIEPHDNGRYSVLWSDGTLSLYSMHTDFAATDDGGVRTTPAIVHRFSVEWPALRNATPRFAMLRGDADDYRAVAIHADGTVAEKSVRRGKGLRARAMTEPRERTVRVDRGGTVLSAALNNDGLLYLGTDGGDLVSVDLSGTGDAAIVPGVTPAFRDRRGVTALSFLQGGYALAAGDAAGGVSVWFPRREEGAFRLRRSGEWAGTGDPVVAISASGRDRGFFALDGSGVIRWLYSTNGRELLALPSAAVPATALAVNPRADAMVTLHNDALHLHRLDGSHPQAGWAGFFRRLLYEGYEKPAFVWQSSGSDASEPKLSLVPLVWGSVKAAAYAMLFATPLALGAAMYLSQFAAPAWRARLKPAVEMLAAVPSVVIGFLAALWLAPLLEDHLRFLTKYHHYDQRNSLVIAIAMGFAVIPTVFSLAEDAISAVPPSLSAASLALGASKWQTVWRVVLPTASPGIFTATMLGFGRAVGETMIVLMAAGNTPLISLSPFDGMRTLSANIAVEMPEAPVGGTLYRTLFLCALILFVLTLIINALAEAFRRRLRQRYGRV